MSHQPLTANLASGLSGEHQRVLARIFQHPLSHNLSWREVLALFAYIGTVDHPHDGDTVLSLADQHLSFRHGQDKDLSPEQVMDLRHFVTRTGWSPDAAAATAILPGTADLAVVMDHEGARVYPLGNGEGHADTQATHHLQHQVKPKQHDADRDETYPADTRYFDQIAAAVAGTGHIVLISHGTGQSNEADHLMAYLLNHHDPVHARVVRSIVADLPHRSVGELLQSARQALPPARQSAAPAVNRLTH